jgi:hypothetical protein
MKARVMPHNRPAASQNLQNWSGEMRAFFSTDTTGGWL